MKSKRFKKRLTNALITALVLFALSAYPVAYMVSAETIEISVKEKGRITTGRGANISSKYVVYAGNEVFENTDSWLYLKFDSADFQSKIHPGGTYQVKVVGWRMPLFSSYRNIVKINE